MPLICLRLIVLGGAAYSFIAAQALARVAALDAAVAHLSQSPRESDRRREFAGYPDGDGTGLVQWSVKSAQLPEYALLISSKGMSSHVGAGVRQMIMMMDLKGCGIGVDTLTEKSKDDPDWSSPIARKVLADSTNFHVRWGGHRSGFTANRTHSLLRRYSQIYLFGWAWELELASIANIALRALESDPTIRSKVTLVLDDNPSNRCYGKHNLSFCRERAPAMLSRWLKVSHRAVAISQQDVAELNELKVLHGLSGPQFELWPMHLRSLRRLFIRDYRKSEGESGARPFLTMVANDHAENMRFVSELVTDGHLGRICNASDRVPRSEGRLQLYFVGKIAYYMRANFRQEVEVLQQSCVHLVHEILDQRLQEDILPKTMAILNPFLKNIQSGISVKTFEAVALNMPIVTSLSGFHGLEKCGQRLHQAGLLPPSSPSGYVSFIVDHLVDPHQSIIFTREQQAILRECMADQEPHKCS